MLQYNKNIDNIPIQLCSLCYFASYTWILGQKYFTAEELINDLRVHFLWLTMFIKSFIKTVETVLFFFAHYSPRLKP